MTAVEDLFVLAHLGIPRVDPGQWSLTIDGRVGRTRVLGLDGLEALPRTIVEAVHQRCGSPLEPTVPTRRVANVLWSGVDLAALLTELEVDPAARFLWSYGLDGGDFAGTSWRLQLAEHRAEGPFTTTFYNDRLGVDDVAAGLPERRPVWATAPDSIMVAPGPDTVVAVGETVDIWGWAWSFRGVAAVEISVDGGASYARATLDPRRGWAWQRFSLCWRPTDRGEAILRARAIESGGAAQPLAGARNAVHEVRVTVR